MRKLSILIQWIVLLGVAGFIGYILLRRPPQPEYTPEHWRSWEGVTLLSYAGIARRDEPVYPSVNRLESHLTALRDAGYQTVTPRDVRAFLDGDSPLPEKALMIIFEGGRKEAFIRATPILQRTGFSAVIVIPTALTRSWGGFYLNASDIRRLIRLPQWHVGSMGHEAYAEIPVDADGTTGRFLTRRRWVNGRRESEADFQARVLADYAESAAYLESAAGRSALVYLYPYADAGQFPGADPLAESGNRAGVTRHFPLAVVGGDEPFNGPGRDPWALSRLRVPGNWEPERLLAELRLSRPRPAGMPSLGRPADWTFDRGGSLADGTLTLPADAAAWLRGSDGWSDLVIEATLSPGAQGIAALYARYAGPLSWIRLSVSDSGLRVQERLPGRLQTLHHHPWAPTQDPTASHAVQLRLRHNRAWVEHNGALLAANLPLAPGTRRGRIGFGAEKETAGVTALKVRKLPAYLLLANSIRQVPEAQHAQLRAILPVWFRATQTPRIGETQRQDLFKAAVSGVETIPMIRDAAQIATGDPHAFVEAVQTTLADLGLTALVRTLALDAPADALADVLRRHGFRMVHVLEPGPARRHGETLAQLSPTDWILINASGEAAEMALDELLHRIPADRLAILTPAPEALGPDLRMAVLSHQRNGKER